jgi:hypothetical protein
VCPVRAVIFLAREVGEGLGSGALLLRAMSAREYATDTTRTDRGIGLCSHSFDESRAGLTSTFCGGDQPGDTRIVSELEKEASPRKDTEGTRKQGVTEFGDLGGWFCAARGRAWSDGADQSLPSLA